MKAVYISKFGADGELALKDVPDKPEPSGTEVLVKVKAAGLNRADLLQLRGLYPPPSGISPEVPGLEFAGVVSKVGESVKRWKCGDRVFGITAGEAQAEFVLTDASLISCIPDTLSFVEAACVPEAFITAHDAIFTLGGLGMHDNLLIHAVGSGVGLAGLQLAKANGAAVIGSSRSLSKIEKCKEFGLDAGLVIAGDDDFSNRVLELTGGRGVDVLFDLVGASYFTENLKCLAQRGRMILVGLLGGTRAEFDMSLALRKRVAIIGTVLRSRSDEEKAEATRRFETEVVPFLVDGTVKPNIDRTLPAEHVAEAYKYLASNESFGKVVIEF